ncbi:MAG: hypothetical protein IKW96_00860 [Ruminococcus sp.]|uniref:dockerin type I domain-containing protein n=1 Tax=Ruminococcus sp. TaxID=41978 RepID=UPI0025E666DD|nr:dockerin type I domain-containing protein [Ruminococcus sp.]MBR5681814.1 hypothetical protein [Ruminococcus sp.]
MRKVISALLTLALALCAVPMAAFAADEAPVSEAKYDNHDFNEDGYIDALDVAFLCRYYLINSAEKASDAMNLGITDTIMTRIAEFGDFNKDGRVNLTDGSLFLKYVISFTNCKIENFEPQYYSAIVSESVEKGDINGDGYVDAIDASNILSYYAVQSTGSDIVTSGQLVCRYKGDINGDGIVDSVDASKALRIYAQNSAK